MRAAIPSRRPHAHPEAGFAMLLVFVMAAALAIMLYRALPRVAFEAQRNKEELLIERGHQYQRAIQLYFRKLKRYPSSLEQLEDTNSIRFLRRRYADPISGKTEWRLIHIGPNGVFTDSLTQGPKKGQDKKDEYRNTFITEGASVGSTLGPSQPATGQPPRRASEQIQPSDPNAMPGDVAGSQPGGANAGQPAPGMPGGFSSGVGAQFPLPGGNQAPVSAFNLPAQPAAIGGSNVPIAGPLPSPSAGDAIAGQQSGFNSGQSTGSTQAADLIGNLLRTPRNAAQGSGLGAGSGLGPGLGSPAVGGGIAGVASPVERVGIKIYNDRTKYNEWEFIYDFGKDKTGAGRMTEQLGSGDPRLASGAQGSQPGFGNAGAFGQSGLNTGGVPGQAGFGAQSGLAGSQSGLNGPGGFFGQTATPGFGQPTPAATGSAGTTGSGSGTVGSGYGSGVGSGYNAPPSTQTPQPQPGARQPGQRQPNPLQPGPIPPIPGIPQPAPTPPAQSQDPQPPPSAPPQSQPPQP